MRDLVIRQAVPGDLRALAEALGQTQFFADHLTRQAAGDGILLTAWKDGLPRGDVYLRLEPAEEAEIREHLPGVPLLTHLEVLPGYRNRGIGTRLIGAAERHLRSLDFDRVALAVEVTNLDAARLYERLGYRNWDHAPVTCYSRLVDSRQCRAEICHVLVKGLVAR